MRLKTYACVALISLLASFASAQQSPSLPGFMHSGSLVDWVQFHFDAALDGYNPYETILSPANVGSVTLKWSYAPSEGWGVTGAPAVANGVMYFGLAYTGEGDSRNDGDNSFSWGVYALNADTGAFLWEYGTGPVFGSPAVANGVVYAVDASSVYALDAGTGVLIWQYDAIGQSQYSSPVVVNNIVYVTSSDKNVYALNAATGELIWKYATAGEILTPPAVANGVLYVNSGSGTVYALNASTGVLVWSKHFGSSIGPPRSLAGTLGGQAVSNGVLYVGIQGTPNIYVLYALDASTGAVIWARALGSLYMETPAVANGMVYVASDGVVYALNANAGAVVWQVTINPNYIVHGGSPVVANGVVYVGAWESTGLGTGIGIMTALDGSSGASLWNYQTERGSGYVSFPTPAVVNGTIYGSLILSGENQVGAWGLPN